MDTSLLLSLNRFFAAHDAVEDPLVAYANVSEVLFLVGLVIAFLVVGGHRRRGAQRAVVAAGLSAAVALAVGQVISRLVDRPRPFVSHHGVHLFSAHAADAGFPSDHTTAAFAIGTAIFLRDRRWGAVVLALATVLGVARVAMGVHYPTDVLGGAALGALVALALWQPRVRAVLHQLADVTGRTVDTAAGAVFRRSVAR